MSDEVEPTEGESLEQAIDTATEAVAVQANELSARRKQRPA